MFNQKMGLRFDGLNVKLKNTTGNIKSSGIKPNAPMTALMSPKNGSIAAIVVAITTDSDRAISLGIAFRAENSVLVGSASVLSSTSFVGCKYTCANSKPCRFISIGETETEAEREREREIVLTTPTADSWRMVKMLVIKMNHLGTKALPLSKKLLRMRPSAWLPNAQYPEMATLKKVTVATV